MRTGARIASRHTIASLEPLPTSLMPEHLLRALTAEQVADPFAYLATLR
jgi:hypothetical protein